jgi:cation diffusion facilitator family transporter
LDNTTKIAIGSIVIGTSVLGLKTAAWWITGSVALLSDALESIVNVATAFAALIAIRVAARPADANHPYGHHKAEYFSAGLEGLLIIGASILILHEAYGGFMAPAPLDAPIEGLFLNGVATAINAFWAWVLISRGRKLRSPALHADGKHLLTDVITSAGVAIGILLAMITGWWFLDPLRALLVAVNILWSGSKVVKASLSGLMDEAVPADVLDVVQQVIATQANGALEAHDILTRQAGQITFIDFHLVVPGQMTVFDAHEICDRVEAALRRAMPGAKVNIHLEPEHKSKDTGIPVHDSAT